MSKLPEEHTMRERGDTRCWGEKIDATQKPIPKGLTTIVPAALMVLSTEERKALLGKGVKKMATKEVLVDDLDGTVLADDAHHVELYVDGEVATELDLNDGNTKAMLSALAEFIKASPNRPTGEEIRAWAKKNGFKVGKRGRLSDDVVRAYRSATAA